MGKQKLLEILGWIGIIVGLIGIALLLYKTILLVFK